MSRVYQVINLEDVKHESLRPCWKHITLVNLGVPLKTNTKPKLDQKKHKAQDYTRQELQTTGCTNGLSGYLLSHISNLYSNICRHLDRTIIHDLSRIKLNSCYQVMKRRT